VALSERSPDGQRQRRARGCRRRQAGEAAGAIRTGTREGVSGWLAVRRARAMGAGRRILDGQQSHELSNSAAPVQARRPSAASVWFLTSFLGATAVGFLVGRFFPEVKAKIFGLGGLPPVTRDGLFVLVLIVAGVTVQALGG
jgi:hypothetical protein